MNRQQYIASIGALPSILREKQEEIDTMRMQTELTHDEQVKIAFFPCVIAHMIWKYVDEVLSEAAANKVSILLPISRAIKELRKEYEHNILNELDYKHRKTIETQTDKFMVEFGRDFALLYFSVNGEFKKKLPNYPYDTMRSKAIIAMLFIDLLDGHNRKMDMMIRERLGEDKQSIRIPMMAKLHHYMEAIAGDAGKFDFANDNVKNGIKVMYNRLLATEFDTSNL